MLPENFIRETVNIVVDTSNPLEVECLELFKARASVFQIESRMKSYLFENGALNARSQLSLPMAPAIVTPKVLKRFPKGKNFDILRVAAQHVAIDNDWAVEMLYGDVTERAVKNYRSRRCSVWKKNHWVFHHSTSDWRVTDELKRWFEDHHRL